MSALVFSGVRAGYGGKTILGGVSASFAGGHVTGIVGSNGACKTTLLRAALGLIEIQSGAVEILGRALKDYSREGLARTVAYLPQEGGAQWPMLARRVVALGRMPYGARDDGQFAIDDAMSRADVAQFAARRMDELSAGERARVLLARTLATQAPVLLVDEPAAHLDPAHQLRLMELLRADAARGVAVVITLHDLALASRFCDAVVVMRSGRVMAQGTPDVALSDAALADVFGITAMRMGRAVIPVARL